jgi:PAS domain S-box-containing protein
VHPKDFVGPVLVHSDGEIVYANDGFLELTGYRREEVIRKNCRFLQGTETGEKPVAAIRDAIKAQQPVTEELRNYRKDGTMFWNRLTITPVRNEAGEVTHFLGFQEDISETKVYEQEKALFEKNADASAYVMFITDDAGVIEHVNSEFERTTGYTAAEAIGKTPNLLKSGEQDGDFYAELWEKIEAGETWEAELTNRTRSGEVYQVEQTIVPITDDRGEITNHVAIERDITDEQITVVPCRRYQLSPDSCFHSPKDRT